MEYNTVQLLCINVKRIYGIKVKRYNPLLFPKHTFVVIVNFITKAGTSKVLLKLGLKYMTSLKTVI